MSGAPPDSPPATRLLRACSLITALAAVSALVGSGLVALPGGVLLALLVVGAAAAPDLFTSAHAVRVRRFLSAITICAALLWALADHRTLDSAAALANLPGHMGTRLALLAAGLLIAQMLLGDRQREVLVSLLVCAGLFVFALAAGPGPAVGVALVLAWPAAVTALAVAHLARQRVAADVHATAVGGRVMGPVAAGPLATVVVGSAVVGLLVVLLGPQPQGLQPGRGGPSGSSGDAAGPSTGREVSAYTHGTLDLRGRGTLPATPVADVPVDSPALWLGTTLALYDGTTWRTPDPGVLLGAALPGGPPYALAPDSWDVATATRADRLAPREGFGGVLLTPGHPVALDVQARVLPISGGYFLVPLSPGAGYPTSYVVTSSTTEPPVATLRAAVAQPPTALSGPSIYTALPDTVPARVRELGARLTAGATTRYDATAAVERYLRHHATYRLDSPVPPPGADAVDHFLFTARSGFCEQFASAEVVLLRAAGIPARLATGFSGGKLEGDHRTLRGSDAHAWVEVLYPGVGWAASDPTAGTRLAQDSNPLHRLSQLLHDAKGRALLAGLVVAASLLGGAAAWLLGRWMRRRRRRLARRRRRAQPPVLAAFGRLERALARTGAPRSRWESIGELGRRPSLAPVAGALAVVERACYAASPPTPEESDQAVSALDDLARRLLADA